MRYLDFFLTDEKMERIFLESTIYARLRGEHKFTMTLDELKAFIAILLVSGYTELPRQEMYWRRIEDGHNLLASSMISKNKILSENNNLDMAHRFAKVHPLFFNQPTMFIKLPAYSVYQC